MGDGVLELGVSWVVTTALEFLVVVFDERRLRGERLERAWPSQSRDAAIVAFGPLALLVHFARTRGHVRSVRGVAGLAWGVLLGTLAVLAVVLLGGLVVEAVLRLI